MMTGIAPLISSTPYRRIRSRVAIRDQFIRLPITHYLSTRIERRTLPNQRVSTMYQCYGRVSTSSAF